LDWVLEVWLTHRNLRGAWGEVEEAEETGEGWAYDLPEMKSDDFDYRTYGVRDGEDPRRMLTAPLDAFRGARKRVGRAWTRRGSGAYDSWYRETDRYTVGHFAIQMDDSAWLVGTGRVNLRGLYPWVPALSPPTVAQDIALLDLDRQIVEWERNDRWGVTREGVDAAVSGCERGLLTMFEMPTRREIFNQTMRRLQRRGVDLDSSGMRTRVLLALLEEDDQL
jgi:hypothetical protein